MTIFEVPDPEPDESVEVIDHVLADFERHGVDPPEWMQAIKALRDATEGEQQT